ncbi:hypothetical protein ACFVT5_13215 [Streptomyces sp. NPDC058001]|uniref:hypothetical protein n=1 Tax=Streptomyces sp. NPDC058001 TaxID=3346300 RepID=UPI0036E4C0F9
MLHSMSTTPGTGESRTPTEVNEDIRALWTRAGGSLTIEQRREYQRLVTEWSAALRSGTEAA